MVQVIYNTCCFSADFGLLKELINLGSANEWRKGKKISHIFFWPWLAGGKANDLQKNERAGSGLLEEGKSAAGPGLEQDF